MLFFGCGSSLAAAPKAEFKDATTENRYKSIVRIIVKCDGDEAGQYTIGSGVAISRNTVITARHVVDCAPNDISLLFYDGHRVPVVAVVASFSMDPDAEPVDAVRLITKTPLTNWMEVNYNPPKIGEQVCYNGGGGELKHWTTKCGEVTMYNEDGTIWSNILTVPGNSGGPVFDSQWRVVGIMNWRYVLNDGSMTVDWEEMGRFLPARLFP